MIPGSVVRACLHGGVSNAYYIVSDSAESACNGEVYEEIKVFVQRFFEFLNR